MVMDFYNQRRKGVMEAQPNEGHLKIAEWQREFSVTVVTQNIDDLHERAGSKDVVHLHGEIRKSRSTVNPELIYPIQDWSLAIGDRCELGSQLRPHIVWFGEEVPMLQKAAGIIEEADIFIVIGTSLQVYPAAGLVSHAFRAKQKFIVDPNANNLTTKAEWTIVADGAVSGLKSIDANMLR
jgi:NAD-dependent deacetylase